MISSKNWHKWGVWKKDKDFEKDTEKDKDTKGADEGGGRFRESCLVKGIQTLLYALFYWKENKREHWHDVD